jgi:hypothetical protein
MFGNNSFDDILRKVRAGEELYVPVGGMGLGIENVKGNKVSKAGINDFLRVAKSRAFSRNPISPNQADYVNWILYDRISYAASATVPNLSKLFVAPIGTNNKTKVDTNLELVSSLPAPQWMNVCGVSFYFQPNVAPVDLDAYLASEYMEFWVSQKVYLEGPMDQFPSAGGVFQNVSLGTMTAAATSYTSNSVNGWPSAHNLYDVRLPAGLGLGTDGSGAAVVADGILGITILQSQTFHVELKADAGGATLAANNAVPINGNGLTVACRLHGILSRGVQ